MEWETSNFTLSALSFGWLPWVAKGLSRRIFWRKVLVGLTFWCALLMLVVNARLLLALVCDLLLVPLLAAAHFAADGALLTFIPHPFFST